MGLDRLPAEFARVRAGLHRVAEELVAPARKPHNEIALAVLPGGFGTPPFELEGRQLRVAVDGVELVITEDGAERRREIASIAEAAAFAGPELFPDGLPDDETPLGLDADAARALASFHSFGAAALERLAATTAPADETSPIILWPEHFDVALESGPEGLGRRANYGASPGDETHSEPYLYVGPWQDPGPGELWNASGFTGAELGYAELVEAGDPAALADRFFTIRREALAD